MQNGKAKGEYRNLTPQEIGTWVATFRKMMDWKQLTLALEAGVHERTVQRIERGEKVDDESLRKIAKALRLRDPGFLGPRYIPTQEELQAQAEKMHKELTVIEARSLSTIKDCEAVLGGDGNIVHDSAMPEGMADQVAALRDQMTDSGDIWSELSNTEKLEACRSFLAEVQKIEEQGFKIRYGAYETDDHFQVAVLMFGASNDERFANLTQLIVPRNFAKMAIESLRRG
jgi:transcriptional regulator with XRE-family HTH domain